MKKTYLKQKSAISTILAVATIITIIVAGIAVAYYFTNFGTNQKSPLPSAPASTENPSSTNSTEPIANFHDGVHTTYVVTNYDYAGQALQQNITLQQTIGVGSYNEITCWKLIDSIQTNVENGATTSINTFYVYKGSFEAAHLSVRNYTIEGISSSNELDISPAQNLIGILLTKAIDPRNAIGYEDVQVTAGMFEHCTKASIIDSQGTTYVWVHPDVPGWGIVKMEMYNQGKIVTAINLNATDPI